MPVTAKVHSQKENNASIGIQTIALAGNPNVGKSVIFNALTGLNVDVSNYPGTTIGVSRGKLGSCELIDTPGAYGVSSFNDEEKVARSGILQSDIVINVVSALSLDRDLFLTLQLIEMGKPLVLVINQWDEAVHRGLQIDTVALSELLSVPVLTCVAVRNEGIEAIRRCPKLARIGNYGEDIEALLKPLVDSGVQQQLALLALEGDEPSASAAGITPSSMRNEIYRLRRQRVNWIVAAVVTLDAKKEGLSIKIGRLLLHPLHGSIVALLVCYLIFYQMLGVLIAGNLVDFTEKKFMRVYYEPMVKRSCAMVFPSRIDVNGHTFSFPGGTLAETAKASNLDKALQQAAPEKVNYDFWPSASLAALCGNLIGGQYGVLTLTVTYLLGLLMPLVLGFYLGLSLLEDSGYLPRLAVLVDRMMNKIGLNGRAIIPLILGLGCVTMATITTRLLSTKREKLIATALLGIAIPCSAQLGVVSGTLARCGGLVSWAVYGTIVASILALTGLLLNMALPGKSGALIIDLPPMRMPRWDNVLKKTWSKSFNFLKESVPMFALAGIVVSLAEVTGILSAFIHLLQPITVTWLQLPNDPRIATTFILGIVRRDFAAFGLTDVSMSAVQAVTAMIVITLFVPCIATVGVMIKERGPKVAFTIWIGSWLCAFLVGGLLARTLPPLFHLAGV